MKDKVIHFLSRFSSRELNHFRDFINSPVFNKRDKVVTLFDHIQKKCLKGEPKDLNEEAAFKQVYPGEKFVVNKIRKLKAVLLDLVLEYYRFRSWEAAKEEKSVHLLREFNRVRESSYFLQYYQKSKDQLAKGGRSELYFDQVFLLERELVLFRQHQPDRSANKNFDEAFQALILSTFTKLTKYAYAALSRKRVIGDAYFPDELGVVVESLDLEIIREEPLAWMYHLLYTSLQHLDNPELIPELTQLITKHIDTLSTEEAQEVIFGANNNLIWQARSQGTPNNRELLDLNRLYYERLVKQRGLPLQVGQFKNMVMWASRLEEFEWCEQFMAEAKEFLLGTEEEIETVTLYNRGVWLLHQSRFEEAESQFHKVMHLISDVFFGLDARAYLLITFYETGNSMGMESLVHSFRMYLDRSERISDLHKQNYGEFIRLFRNLIGTAPGDTRKIGKLKEEVEGLNFGIGRNWMLEKLNLM